jgi:hypothetical protein
MPAPRLRPTMELRTNRVGALLDQLRESRDLYFPRLDG